MRIDELFDFLRINILSTADNHIFKPAGNQESPVRVPPRQIAGMKPSIPVHSSCCGIRHLIIAFHDVVSPGAEFAVLSVGELFSRFRIYNFALDMREGIANCFRTQFKGICPG